MDDTKKDQPKASEPEKAVASPAAEQDNRVAKQKAEAEAQGGGARKPEDGLNQDG